MNTRPIGLTTSTRWPRARFEQARTLARRSRRKIDRTQNPILVVDKAENLFLIGPVIASRDHIDADLEQFIGDDTRQPEASSGVLAIGDHEIERELFSDAGQLRRDHVAAGPPDNVSNKK